MDLLPRFMLFWLIFFFCAIRWGGIAGNEVVTERAECAFPEPCYGRVTETTTFNSTMLSNNATSESSGTTAFTDSTTTATTSTEIFDPPQNTCDLDCGYGECVSRGTMSLCECDEGFVQTHSIAPCRCPATLYYNGSQCSEAPLTVSITYEFQRDFQTDPSVHISDLYKEWSTEIASKIQNQIKTILIAELSARHVFGYLYVLSFRSGCIIADVLITAALYDTNREQDIKNAIETSARNVRFTLAGSELELKDNVTFGYFNRCAHVEENSACAANATCLFTSQTGKAVCDCPNGYQMNSDGRSCRAATATPDISRPVSTLDGGMNALCIALYTIAGVTGAVIIVLTGMFVSRRCQASKERATITTASCVPSSQPSDQRHQCDAAGSTRSQLCLCR